MRRFREWFKLFKTKTLWPTDKGLKTRRLSRVVVPPEAGSRNLANPQQESLRANMTKSRQRQDYRRDGSTLDW